MSRRRLLAGAVCVLRACNVCDTIPSDDDSRRDVASAFDGDVVCRCDGYGYACPHAACRRLRRSGGDDAPAARSLLLIDDVGRCGRRARLLRTGLSRAGGYDLRRRPLDAFGTAGESLDQVLGHRERLRFLRYAVPIRDAGSRLAGWLLDLLYRRTRLRCDAYLRWWNWTRRARVLNGELPLSLATLTAR
jgi:hypothetical protein